MDKVRVGLIGSGFASAIHCEALRRVPAAEVVAVASPRGAAGFAARHAIPRWYADYRELLESRDLDMVVLGIPNDLHCQVTVNAAAAGKHVVVEKPLAMNLEQADRMIEACRAAGVKLMYAEELCFAPKYVRLKQLVEEGALGRVYLVKQSEKHDGPHSAWFWDVCRSGGGVAFDMGCHAVEFFRWMLGKPAARDVYAQLATCVHSGKTEGDDNALILVSFEGSAIGLAEESWTKPGGMDDRAEVYGSEGVAYADLLRGSSILTYSARGYGYAVEKAGETRGWSFTMFEEVWNYGFPQEFEHFVDCVAHDRTPRETGEDGRAVLEILMAAYESARAGRRVSLPFSAAARAPIELWKPGILGGGPGTRAGRE
ncbi:MAG: Gfo/Idh/MocA family protein [Bryobacteraceae bacterium]